MSSLLRAKQLVLLLQDGFRALGEFAPTPHLINALKIELGQLKEMVNDLSSLKPFSNVFCALENLLVLASQANSEQVSAPIYSSENIQIILETLRILSNHLAEVEKPDSINIQDLANVLDMLCQQKCAEFRLPQALQKSSTMQMTETAQIGQSINSIARPGDDLTNEPQTFPLANKTEIGSARDGIANEIPEISPKATGKIEFKEVHDTLNSIDAVKSSPTPLGKEGDNEKEVQSVCQESGHTSLDEKGPGAFQPMVEEKAKKSAEGCMFRKRTSPTIPTKKSLLQGELPVKPYFIVRALGQLFAISSKDIEKVVKLSLGELKLVGNEIFVSLAGNEIALYDPTALFGCPPFESTTSNFRPNPSVGKNESAIKETFLAVVLLTKDRKFGLLCDEILGLADLNVKKFQSILGKIRGIAGVATFYPKIRSEKQSNPEEPELIFVLEPAGLISPQNNASPTN